LSDQESVLAGLIFHELSHQVFYVEDDTRFNESFAKVVEREGVRRWLKKTSNQEDWAGYRLSEKRVEAFVALLLDTKATLEELYVQPLTIDEMRSVKRTVFAETRRRYQAFKDDWDGYAGFDRWFERGLNNARLTSLATYRDLVPAFQALLEQQGGHLPAFYAAVSELGALPKDERLAKLNSYLPVRQVKVSGDSVSRIQN
jgi:predicted aminopeptidase